LKQYTGFTVARKTVQYGSSTAIYLLCLSGSIPIKYQMKDYSIPINIVLPENFPTGAPKVFLAYQLDAAYAKDNPLIKYGNQVLNNYIHKWQGNSQQYNLGGLCYNLSKSFSLYPPFGSQGSTIVSTDIIYINDGTSKVPPKDAIQQEYKVDTEPQKMPQHSQIGIATSAMTEEQQIKYLEEEERKSKLKKLHEKLQTKVDAVNSSISGLDCESKDQDLISQSKEFLEDNSTKIQKQTLILENEKAEMEEGIAFIKKNKDREINESNIDDYVFPSKDGVSEVLLEILAKEQAIEDTIDLVKSHFRKKTIELVQYLDHVRELSEKQFLNLAMKRKVLSALKGTS